jgi:hypothetical protein
VDYTAAITPMPDPVLIPAQNLKRIRQHDNFVVTNIGSYPSVELPCLGIAASTLSEPRINADSPHGQLVRLAAKDLPGLHSNQLGFRKADTEDLYLKVHRGEFIAEWKHTFQSDGEWDDFLFDCRAPTFVIKVLVKQGEEEDLFHMGTLYFLMPSARYQGGLGNRLDWSPELELTTFQRNYLAQRVVHHLFRVIGFDMGYRALYMNWDIFDEYKVRGWWKEFLDVSILWSDFMIQMNQPSECHYLSFAMLGEALEASKLFLEAARLYEQLREEYLRDLPSK